MAFYRAICTIPLYFDAENDNDAYEFIVELFNDHHITYDDIYEIELDRREEE